MLWIVGSLLLLVVAILFDLGLLAYAMYALLGVIIVSRVLARLWSANLNATREMNKYEVSVGTKVAVVITLKNDSKLPIPWMLLEDILPRNTIFFGNSALKVSGNRLQLASLKGKSQKTIFYQIDCNCRGYYQIGPLVGETGDVFGLYRYYRILSEPTFLQVLPEVIPITGFDIASRRPIGEVRMTYRLFEDPTRISGVRGYQLGDSFNRIHWGATARTGALHSKVYEPSTVAGATLLLSFHKQAFDHRDEPVRSELSVTAAASIAAAMCEQGQQIGLVTNGRDAADRVKKEGWSRKQLRSRRQAQATGMLDQSDRLRPIVVPTQQSDSQLIELLRTLARVEKTDGLTFSQLVLETMHRLPRNATVIAILSLVTPEDALALSALQRRGFAVTAIVNVFDDQVFAKNAAILLAERIETRHLKDRASIPNICTNCMVS